MYMLDKVKFMETLRSVAEVAKISENPLSKEEIMEFFDDMELTDEQLTMVFEYLQQPQVEEKKSNLAKSSNQDQTETQEDGYDVENGSGTDGGYSESESKFLKMYLEDINSITTRTNNEIQALYMQLIQGDSMVMQEITDYWLTKVVDLARGYSTYPVNIEDIIQEGNIGLLSGLTKLLGSKKVIDVQEYLKESVQQAIEVYIDEITSEDDWEETILAKTTLINEARKALADENAEIPSIPMLSEYTRITEQEIEDILRLSKDNN